MTGMQSASIQNTSMQSASMQSNVQELLACNGSAPYAQ